jgi:hypothetical protein
MTYVMDSLVLPTDIPVTSLGVVEGDVLGALCAYSHEPGLIPMRDADGDQVGEVSGVACTRQEAPIYAWDPDHGKRLVGHERGQIHLSGWVRMPEGPRVRPSTVTLSIGADGTFDRADLM